MNQSLLIIGPDIKLRGVGGVTIHVQRLRDYLDKIEFEYEFRDYKKNSLASLGRELLRHRMVHIHISNPVYQFIWVVIGRLLGKKVVMTLHGNYGRFGSVKNWMVRRAVTMATIPVVINKQSYKACVTFNEKTELIPAFVPPQREEKLDKDILELIDRLHQEGKSVFATNASNAAVDKDGNDIYGIDFLVNYFQDSEDKALVVSDPSGNYERRYGELHSESVFFINHAHSYFEVLKRVDCSVRNTSTDGDALSVKESLYLGIPTLCTDVVDRPNGVLLYKYSDKESFEMALNTPSKGNKTIENGAERIVEIYRKMLSN